MPVSDEEVEKRLPWSSFYEWIDQTQEQLHEMKEQLHPAVFAIAMRMLPGVAGMHGEDKPALVPQAHGGLIFCWCRKIVPLDGMQIEISPPFWSAEHYEEYNPFRPVHPPGIWREFENRSLDNDGV